MPESIFAIAAIGAVLVGVAKAMPGIIWAIRCPSDSPRYKFPRSRYHLRRLGRVNPKVKGR